MLKNYLSEAHLKGPPGATPASFSRSLPDMDIHQGLTPYLRAVRHTLFPVLHSPDCA